MSGGEKIFALKDEKTWRLNLGSNFDRFFDFLTNASLLSNYLKIEEFGECVSIQ